MDPWILDSVDETPGFMLLAPFSSWLASSLSLQVPQAGMGHSSQCCGLGLASGGIYRVQHMACWFPIHLHDIPFATYQVEFLMWPRRSKYVLSGMMRHQCNLLEDQRFTQDEKELTAEALPRYSARRHAESQRNCQVKSVSPHGWLTISTLVPPISSHLTSPHSASFSRASISITITLTLTLSISKTDKDANENQKSQPQAKN